MTPLAAFLVYESLFYKSLYYHDFDLLLLGFPLAVLASIGFWMLMRRPGARSSMVWRATASLFVLIFLAVSAWWSLFFHRVDNRQYYEWGLRAGEATAPDEIVATNLPVIGPYIGYYAERRVVFGISPAEALAPDRPPEWGYLIACADDAEEIITQADVVYEKDASAGCILADLNP